MRFGPVVELELDLVRLLQAVRDTTKALQRFMLVCPCSLAATL